MFKTTSGFDGGTLVLYQLKNLLQRRMVKKKIGSDPTSSEEFFVLVVDAYILSSAMKAFEMSSLDDVPKIIGEYGTNAFEDLEKSKRMDAFIEALTKLIDELVAIGYPIEGEQQAEHPDHVDHVFEYTKEVISLGLLYKEFINSIREGDGDRILRCWRYFLLLFKSARHDKYSVEAFNLLVQYHFLFTERMKMQLLWSRTVNTHGKRGKNVPMDLHMEHLNRQCKGAINHLRANIAEINSKSRKVLKAILGNHQQF